MSRGLLWIKIENVNIEVNTDDLGDEEAAFKVSYAMNSRAPLTLRVNPLKITKH